MSPSGKVHVWPAYGADHIEELHPDAKLPKNPHDEQKIIKDQLKQGFTRFQRYPHTDYGNLHGIHFDNNSKGGNDFAKHALEYLKPGPGENVSITKNSQTKEFYNLGQAQTFLKSK